MATFISFGERLVLKIFSTRSVRFDLPILMYIRRCIYRNLLLVTLIYFFEHLIIEGKFKSDQGLRSPLVPVKVVYVLQPPFLFLFLAYTQKWFNTLKILVDFVSRRVD